jgi:lipoyl(octanoyl) transferase
VSERLREVIRAGRVPYREALEWQRRLAQERIAGREEQDLLLLLEHPPVVTLGRSSHQSHLLRADGIDVFEVERGGDVTYHGPGQLVGYPILDLSRHRQDLHWYLRTLEQALIDALAELGIPAERRPGYTGVWTRQRKIASLGVHVKQWVTWHGFALNVTTDPGEFERIVPCGIPGVVMTSVAREIPTPTGMGNGERGMVTHATALWDDTVAAVTRCFARAFGLEAKFVEEKRRGTASRGGVTKLLDGVP